MCDMFKRGAAQKADLSKSGQLSVRPKDENSLDCFPTPDWMNAHPGHNQPLWPNDDSLFWAHPFSVACISRTPHLSTCSTSPSRPFRDTVAPRLVSVGRLHTI